MIARKVPVIQKRGGSLCFLRFKSVIQTAEADCWVSDASIYALFRSRKAQQVLG